MSYPDNAKSPRRAIEVFRCVNPFPTEKDEEGICSQKFEVMGIHDHGNFTPEEEPQCPKCGSFNVE